MTRVRQKHDNRPKKRSEAQRKRNRERPTKAVRQQLADEERAKAQTASNADQQGMSASIGLYRSHTGPFVSEF